MRLVEHSREGSGEARVCNLELLTENRNLLSIVNSGMKGIIRISVVFLKNCQCCIGYHIRDEKNEPVLGSNTLYEGYGEVSGKAGDRIIVEFTTELPLKEGRFNIMTVMSTTLYLNRTFEFIDITKDGLYFDVLEKKPCRIWNMVQLPNTVSIKKIKN